MPSVALATPVLHPTPERPHPRARPAKKEALLDHLKECIIQSLAAYSALVEVNSYFIEQNNYLLLARLRDKDSGGRRFEIKYYTHAPLELLTRYEDKIYIGRDFVDLFNFKRKYFGIRELIASLQDQTEKLVDQGRGEAEAAAGLQGVLPGDPRIGQRAQRRKPWPSSSPCRRPSTSPS